MNQILFINNKSSNTTVKVPKQYKKAFFIIKILFSLSIVLIIISICTFLFRSFSRNENDYISKKIISNYNITKLYSNTSNSVNSYAISGTSFNVIGLIEIPKLNIIYPILSELNDYLLKIAPCRFSGPLPNENGNLCIAGHNYDNSKLFSKITSLEIGDSINIYNASGNKQNYIIFEKKEVSEDDLSALNISQDIQKQVTLITCNNLTSNRIIIKAK